MTKNEAILNYLDTFPLIERYGHDKYVSLEWIDKDIIFGINDNPLGSGGVISKDVLGNVTKAYSFMFSAFFGYSRDVLSMLENSEFFEELEYWIEDNNRKGILPVFDNGRKSLSIQVVQTPYLFMVSEDNTNAQYSMILQLNYKERK